MSAQSTHVGGQAVLEGVMMRHEERLAIAVRKPDNEIFLHNEVLAPPGSRWRVLRWPVLRGVVALVDALVLGTRALTISANQALDEEEEEELSGWQLTLTVVVALSLAVMLFFILPTLLTRFVVGVSPATPLLANLFEGFIRLGIFLSYVFAISRLEDIRRVFQYHGAEHKAIYCYEAGALLTVDNARRFPSLHPRCGTSFLLLVMVVSIVLFSFFGWPDLAQRLFLRLSLLPVVAGISYEMIRLAGQHRFFAYLTAPGIWLQRLTTREPNDQQLEVAIHALRSVIPR